MKLKIQIIILVLITVVINIAADQATKEIARQNLKGQPPVQVIDTVFVLVYAENTGAFLGMGKDLPQPWKTIALIIMPVLAVLLSLAYVIFGKNLSLAQVICISSVLGGGLSNLYDRIMNAGAVTDFMNFGIGPVFRTGVLNVADLSVTFGAILLVLFYMNESEKTKRAAKQTEMKD